MNKACSELSEVWRGRPASLGAYKQVEFWLLLSSAVISAKTVTVTVSPRKRWVNTYLFLHTIFLTLLSFHLLQNSISLVINYNETQLLQMQKHIKCWHKTFCTYKHDYMKYLNLYRKLNCWEKRMTGATPIHTSSVYNLNTFNYNLLLFIRLERHGLPVQWY